MVVWCDVIWLCGVRVSFMMARDLLMWCCDVGFWWCGVMGFVWYEVWRCGDVMWCVGFVAGGVVGLVFCGKVCVVQW